MVDLIQFVVLLSAAFFWGRRVEKRHYRSIVERERSLPKIPVIAFDRRQFEDAEAGAVDEPEVNALGSLRTCRWRDGIVRLSRRSERGDGTSGLSFHLTRPRARASAACNAASPMATSPCAPPRKKA
jgi:hypothetical protein